MENPPAGSTTARGVEATAHREKVNALELESESMKMKCKKLVKALGQIQSVSTEYENCLKFFHDELKTVVQSFQPESQQELGTRLVESLIEAASKQAALLKAHEQLLAHPLREFLDSNNTSQHAIQVRVNDARKDYEAQTEKLHSLRKKGGDAEKVQRLEAEESKSRQQFDSVTTEYAHKMEDGLAEVQSMVTNGLINYFREYNSACRNGSKLWSDLEPSCKKYFADRIAGKKIDSKEDVKSPTERPLAASANNVLSAAMGSPSPLASVVPVLGGQAPEIEKQVKQGYLWVKNKKKGGSWKKRWVSVINGRLLYYKNWKTNVPKETFNLFTCSAKRWEDSSRPFGFELQSADMRNLVFCANDDRDLQQWLDVINGIITSLFNSMNSGAASAAKSQAEENNAYAELMEIKGNEVCADCGRADPDWAVMNHGITICIECSGVHRSLGVHISKVRSLKLDVWEPELLLMMKSIGNVKSNASVYEAALTDKERITPSADRTRREAFIKAKYMDKKWVPSVSSASAIVSLLLKKKRFVPVVSILKLICQGADPNWQDPQDGVALLHRCAADDNVTAVEFLFTIGAKLDIPDKEGQTPLHYAAKDDAAAAIRLLLTHGASTEVKDAQGKTPLHLAREANSVDAISLLDNQEESSSVDVITPRGTSTPEIPPRRTSKFNLNAVGSPTIRVLGDSIGTTSPRGASTSSMLSPREKARARRTMTFAEDAKAREDFLKALEEEGAVASPPIVKSPSGETLASRLDPSAVSSPRTPRSSSGRSSNSESTATPTAASPLVRNLSTESSSSRRRGTSESVGRHTSSSSGSKDRDKDKSRGKSSSSSSSRDKDKDKDKDRDKDKHRSRKDSDKDKPRHHERQSSNTSTRSSSSLSNSNDALDSARGDRPDSARGDKSESTTPRDRASSIRISTSSATSDSPSAPSNNTTE